MYQETKNTFMGGLRVALVVGLTSLLLTACAAAPLEPTSALNAAREAIASAEQEGARQHAGGELDEAQQKLEAAMRSVSAEDMVRAERLAQEAAVAAELAEAKTESVKAAEINREMGRSAEALSDEMRRSGEQQ